MPPFLLQDRPGVDVVPLPVPEKRLPEGPLRAETAFLEAARAGGIIGEAAGPDPVQAQFLEAQTAQDPDGVAAQAAPPAGGIPQMDGDFPVPVFPVDLHKAASSDELSVLQRLQGELVHPAGRPGLVMHPSGGVLHGGGHYRPVGQQTHGGGIVQKTAEGVEVRGVK